MARSHSIYVVLRHEEPVAAFTVKHELERYLARDDRPWGTRIWKLRDGIPSSEPVDITDDYSTAPPKA